jgi:hypothetical protein
MAEQTKEEYAQNFIAEYRRTISATPFLLSLLYDADLLPEQIVGERGAKSLAAVVIAYQRGLEDAQPKDVSTPNEQVKT